MKPIIGLTTRTVLVRRERVYDPCQALAEYYLDGVLAAGGIPVLLPSSAGAAAAERLLDGLDGVLLSGGGDLDPRHYGAEPLPGLGAIDPARDEAELALARACVDRDVPLLGICRGAQVLNVALGGTLIQDLGSAGIPGLVQHDVISLGEGPGHTVRLEPGSRLAALAPVPAPRVNSSHHQAVLEPGGGLVVTSRAPDGVVEGLELPDRRFVLGVQWHPERTRGLAPFSDAIFGAFVAAAGGGKA